MSDFLFMRMLAPAALAF